MAVRFDDSLIRLVELAVERFGTAELVDAVVVRDAGGRLSLVLAGALPSEMLSSVEHDLKAALGGYARLDFVIRDKNGPGSRRLLEEATAVPPISVGGHLIRVLDRRIVGADWLRPPAPSATCLPCLVFASLKGGVGRSTALCVVAAHLSRRGRRVLAVDFDLEAPGLGTMLLEDSELSRFGTLDYLVESGLSGIDDAFMADLGGDSFLGRDGARVTVVPAIGRSTIDHPGDALAKIARAYLEYPELDGRSGPEEIMQTGTLSDHLRGMIARFERTGAYDVVLVDARAGLHETTAAAILGLGGEVLLFGTDHPQTYLGYRLLMAHLGRFPAAPEDDWRERLSFVLARASDSTELRREAEWRFLELYDVLRPAEGETAQCDGPVVSALTASGDDFDVGWDEASFESPEADVFEPPPVLHVLDDGRYRAFNPVLERGLLASVTYSLTFGALLDFADGIVDASEAWES